MRPAREGLSKQAELYLGVFLIALAARVVPGFLMMPWDAPLEGDAPHYLRIASTLQEHGVYGFGADRPTAFRMPGLPALHALLLAAGVRAPGALRLALMIVSALGVTLCFHVVRRHCSAWIALVAAVGLSVEPYGIVLGAVGAPEPLAFLAVSAGIWMLAERRYAAAGTAFGCGILCHPAVVLVAASIAAVAAWLALRRPDRLRVREAALFVVLCGSVVAPWAVRNALTFGRFIPLTTQAGDVLYGANNPLSFAGTRMGDWIDLDSLRAAGALPEYPGEDESARSRRVASLAIGSMRENVDRLPLMQAAKLARWAGIWRGGGERPVATAAVNLAYWLCCLPGLVWLLRSRHPAQPLAFWSTVALLATAAGSQLLYGSARFRYPTALFFGLGWGLTAHLARDGFSAWRARTGRAATPASPAPARRPSVAGAVPHEVQVSPEVAAPPAGPDQPVPV